MSHPTKLARDIQLGDHIHLDGDVTGVVDRITATDHVHGRPGDWRIFVVTRTSGDPAAFVGIAANVHAALADWPIRLVETPDD